MINIILSGALGKMGKTITRLAENREGVKIVAGIDRNAAAGTQCGAFEVFAAPAQCTAAADALLDFSHPSALPALIDYCVGRRLPMVVGTTGADAAAMEKLRAAAKVIPVFYSANMSAGVLFFARLVKFAAKQLYPQFDIEIIEEHHNQKVDAPSGTAMLLFNGVKSVINDAEAVFDRHSVSKKREKREIGIHSVRGGGIVGTHEVLFAGENENIRLTHSAFSKDIFAAGALDAAAFLAGKPAGLYNVESILGAE